MIKILPSIASADPLRLWTEIERIAPIGRLHIDIEDGNFVDNITFGKKTVESIANNFNGELDVHLMVTSPESYLNWLAEAGVKAVCAHLEALTYPKRFLARARSLGMRAGLAINLKVRPEELESYSDAMDYVLVMTSEPDWSNQTFFNCATRRVAHVRKLLPHDVQIWCDGGITPERLEELSLAGMDVAVMGRAIFGAENPMAAIAEYEKIMGVRE